MKRLFVVIGLLLVLLASACGAAPSTSQQTIINEHNQQDLCVAAIQRNQPVPDLGGYSFQRQMVIQYYLAQNKVVSTWTYTFLYNGTLVEICPSRGYPIAGGTELTNPLQIDPNRVCCGVIGYPESNSLYPPPTSAGTIVTCVNPDGSVSPEYWEPDVFAKPYRIKADKILERVAGNDGKSSISVTPGGVTPPPQATPTCSGC